MNRKKAVFIFLFLILCFPGGVAQAEECRSDSCLPVQEFSKIAQADEDEVPGTDDDETEVPATGTGSSNQKIEFTNPLAFDTVEDLLGNLLQTLQRIIVTLALVFLVIGAILYIISGGNEGRMETGKKAITAAMIGLALGLAAPSFLREIGQVLGWGAVDNAAVAGYKSLTEIALNVLKFLLSIVGVLGVIMFVVGGLTYLTAAGNEDQLDSAKKMVKYAIVGIIVAFGSLVIVAQIANFFM